MGRRIGILTGGGDVPGLNGVIKSFVGHAIAAGHEVLGLRRGWEGLVRIIPDRAADNSRWVRPLDAHTTRTIDRTGGTVLHTTRLNPEIARLQEVPDHLRASAGAPDASGRYDLTPHALRTIEYLGLDVIVAIGGDGTLTFARRLDREGVPIIGIPKTMDNDVFGTDYCLGFSTAITRAVGFINDLRTGAGSHERVLIVELFGRYSGETCLLTSYLAGTDRAVIAEVPFDPQRLYERLSEDRANNPSGYAILAISEGAVPIGGSHFFGRGEADAAGNRRLGGVGEFVSDYFERVSGERVIYQRLAYLMRSGTPDSLDQLVAKNFGRLAADLIGRQEGSMVAIVEGRYAPVPIQISGEQRKRVDVDRFYDAERFLPRTGDVIGLPMFHY